MKKIAVLIYSQSKRVFKMGNNEYGKRAYTLTNLHAVVLLGLDGTFAHVMNLLTGYESIPIEVFKQSFETLHNRAVVVYKKVVIPLRLRLFIMITISVVCFCSNKFRLSYNA